MAEGKDPKLALFELYLATAEKVSDRRAQANAWMLSVNSAIVALYGYLQADKMAVSAAQKGLWLLAIPAAGVLVCLAWAAMLTSYRKLNRAKFEVLQQIELDLPVQLFTLEQKLYHQTGRRGLARLERYIPFCFAGLYLALFIAAILAQFVAAGSLPD